jgi:hypothetical protein
MTLPMLVGLAMLVHGQVGYTRDDTYQALYDAAHANGVAHARLYRIVACETGYTFNPYSVGDRGQSLGAAQLHRRGRLGDFYSRGYSDPFNPYEAIDYLAVSINEGDARYWTCR